MTLLEAIHRVRRCLYPTWLDFIPTRYLLCVLVFFGLFNVYTLRITLSVAILEMNKDHRWDAVTQSFILSSFYIGYIVTNLYAGRLAELFGGNLIFGLGIIVTSVLNLLTPLAYQGGYGTLVLVRIVEGIAEGLSLPAIYTIFGKWCPKSERTVMRILCEIGLDVGTIAGSPLTGYLCSTTFLGGWPSVFYLFGLLGIIWWILWLILAFESPAEHLWISQDELTFILNDQGLETARKPPSLPWFSILCSCPFWSLAFGVVLSGYFTSLIRINYPTFLKDVMHFNILKIGWINMLPQIVDLFTSLFVGILGDYIISRYPVSRRTFIRKAFNLASCVIQVLFMVGVVLVGEHPMTVCVLISFMYGMGAVDMAGSAGTIVDMSPVFAGSVYGILNALGNLTGVTAPIIIGKVTKGQETSWRVWYWVFGVSMAMNVAGTVVFLAFGSSDLQPWGLEGDEVSWRKISRRFFAKRRALTINVATTTSSAEANNGDNSSELSSFPPYVGDSSTWSTLEARDFGKGSRRTNLQHPD